MKIYGRRKKKSLQERKLNLIQQIKEIEIQLYSMNVRELNRSNRKVHRNLATKPYFIVNTWISSSGKAKISTLKSMVE